MGEWISVKDKLPTDGQYVIFVCKNGDMFCGRYRRSGWVIYGAKGRAMRGRIATYWMPQPERPIQ